MATYSIIQNGVVTNVIEALEAFIVANHNDDIAILGSFPIGYRFDGDKLLPPESYNISLNANHIAPTLGYISPATTVITVAAMKARVLAEEFYAIQNSSDIYVKKIWSDLESSLYIDLNDARFIQGVSYVLAHLSTVPNVSNPNVMTVTDVLTRLNTLIADGTTIEKYNGVL
jgi:hypothetical protein